MLELLFFVVITGVLPVVINKSTEGSFHWIKPYLREIWMAIFVFFSIYLLQRPAAMEVAVKLHALRPVFLGYVVCGIVGASLLCGYWWLTGKMLANPQKTASYVESARFEAFENNRTIEVGKTLAFRLAYVNHSQMAITDIAPLGSVGCCADKLSDERINEAMMQLRTKLDREKSNPARKKLPMDIGDGVRVEFITHPLDDTQVSALLSGSGHIYFFILIDWVGADDLPGHIEKCFFINEPPKSKYLTVADLGNTLIVPLTRIY